MKWIIGALVVFGSILLFQSIIVVEQYYSDNGLKHASLITSVVPFSFAIISFLSAYGCARRKRYAWRLVIVLLSAILVGSTAYAAIAFRFSVFRNYGPLIWDAFIVWLLYLWWPKKKLFEMPGSPTEPLVASAETVVVKRKVAAFLIWTFFGLCCLPVLYHAFNRILMLYVLFTRASPGGP